MFAVYVVFRSISKTEKCVTDAPSKAMDTEPVMLETSSTAALLEMPIFLRWLLHSPA